MADLVARGVPRNFYANIVDADGDPVAADTLTLTIRDPAGDVLAGFPVSIGSFVNPALGTYYYVWTPAADADLGLYIASTSGTAGVRTIIGSETVEVVSGEASGNAYCTLEDVLALMTTRPASQALLNRLDALRIVAAEEINDEIGLDFFQHPASGTEVRYFDGDGGCELHIHEGLVSLTSLEIRLTRWDDYLTIDPQDWDLVPTHRETGRPYDHVRLLGILQWSLFPEGSLAIRATGVFGWSTYPQPLVEANAERTRQLAANDATYSGSGVGPPEYGSPMPYTRLPDVLWRFLRREERRFMACST